MTLEMVDPTVAREAELRDIERFHGISLRDTPPKVVQFVVDQSKSAGNQAFREGRFKGATSHHLAKPNKVFDITATSKSRLEEADGFSDEDYQTAPLVAQRP